MHATQPQGGTSPEPHGNEPENPIVGLLSDDTRFRTWIAQAPLTAAQPPATQDQPDLKSMTQEAFYRWSQGTNPTAAPHSPSLDDGYTVTGRGLKVLQEGTSSEAPGTAAQVLRDAALYLERHGWITGAYYDNTSQTFTPAACMVGAIGMVCYGGPVDAPAQHFDDPGFLDFEEAVLHLDRYLLVEDGSEAYDFNDARGRTLDQVTDVLRKAAARPAEELIDALKVIDARSADVAALAELLKPCGIWGENTTSAPTDGGDV